MRIAVLAPLKRELSEDTKGGRPRIVYNLVQELAKRGHDITVFGTGDSEVHGRLIEVVPKALFHMPQVENEFYRHLIYLCQMMELIRKHDGEFDIIHNHLYPETLPLLLSRELSAPMVTTVHTQMTRELGDFFSNYPNTYFAPISNRQKELYPGLTYTDTVYNGIDDQEFSFHPDPGEYLLFVGRIRDFFTDVNGNKIDPKGVTDAIRIAEATGSRLKILGNVESYPFFEREIAPHLGERIEFVGDPRSAEGSLTLRERIDLYGHAQALLLPVHWEEPFGIVMIEAMSCGVPVIGYRRGAVPEVIEEGVTGYVVDTEVQMVDSVGKVGVLSRQSCRNAVETRFTTRAMTDGYEAVYQKVKIRWEGAVAQSDGNL
jgi:glycosyltransferase involved in cell wall biosynthesis